ncbi:ATP-binding protein [Desulfurispira natronophila]|uniref:histidine kinase n=1 Tax=Desulfurispira natronophila TaxID=682562 RepID=A0A7W7Y3L6_9BACT|nr:ATP-binding protein [Desulfurispira natronophila]MBB5021463.1 signal transduction histidine kinase [Desulfurispira natronophila]
MILRNLYNDEKVRASWEALFLSTIILLVAGMSIGWFYLKAYEAVLESERRDLERLALAAAATIDVDHHRSLNSPDLTNSPAHLQALKPLFNFHRKFPDIHYLYTAIQTDEGIFFVLDTRSTDVFGRIPDRSLLDDGRLLIPYQQPSATIQKAFAQQRLASDYRLYEDEYGTFLSAYAPLWDSSGNFIGLVGVDIAEDEFMARLSSVRQAGLIGFIISLAFAAIIAFGHWHFRRHQFASEQTLRRREEKLMNNEFFLTQAQFMAKMSAWSINLEAMEVTFDGRFYAMMGYPSIEGDVTVPLWEHVQKYLHPDDQMLIQQHINLALKGDHSSSYRDSFECRYLHADGSIGYLSIVVSKISSDSELLINNNWHANHTTIFGVALDITERKRSEAYLQDLNRNLEDKVQQSVQRIRQKEQMLLHQSRLATMGEMLANIAHQWRQPLTAACISIQDLQMEAEEQGEVDVKFVEESVAIALEQMNFMSRTIDDFRNLFRPDKEKVLFCLKQTIEDAIFLLEPSLRSKGIDIHFSGQPEVVLGHPNEFAQVIMNIVNNSRDILSKRNVDNPAIWIHLEQNDGYPTVTIADNGGGIDAKAFPYIFEPYFSTKDTSKGNAGSGLGLYMSKVIVEQSMGGTISADNMEGGACFTITLNTREKIT